MAEFKNMITLTRVSDGAPGSPGAPGQDAQKYRIESNQQEILKFYDISGEKETLVFSPSNFSFSIYKIVPSNEGGEELLEIKSLNNFSFSIFDTNWIDFKIPQNIDEKIFYSINFNQVTLHLSAIQEYIDSNPDYDNSTEEIRKWYLACKTLVEKEPILRIKYTAKEEEKIYIVEGFINIRYGMNAEMAKLSLKAQGIYASINSTALEFTGDGLTVKNGGLKIKNNNGEEVFGADTNGNLEIHGTIYATNGSFTGEVKATSGSFTGEVKAASGSIGGFTIEDGCLRSGDKESIVLYGTEGKIVAKNIELGDGAKITGSLQIGDYVHLKAITKNNSSFLTITNDQLQDVVTFNGDGTLVLGPITGEQIKLSGADQTIIGWDEKNNTTNWLINPQGATFNNITAKGSIKASVFEYGIVQAIGGQLLVRPSSKISKINGKTVTLEAEGGNFQKNDYCLSEYHDTNGTIQKEYFKVEDVNGLEITLSKNVQSYFINSPLINLGQAGAIAVGINGSLNDSFMPANAVSILEFQPDESKNIYTLNSKIILGKLPNIKEIYGSAANSYGLYAENVILNGALTTKTATSGSVNNYSGIGTTLGGNNAPTTKDHWQKFPNALTGQILIWAGASSDTKEGIEKSKFFVDQYGNMYAGSGYFDGTIITNSTIEAATIKAATLTCRSTDTALNIRGSGKAIEFYGGDETDTQKLFELSSENLTANLPTTINTNFIVDEVGNLETPQIVVGDNLTITDSQLKYLDSTFAFNNSVFSFSPGGKKSILSIDTQGVSLKGSIYYKNEDGTKTECEYRQIKDSNNEIIGYDLYIF